jgi:hypothetical protein
MAAEGGNIIRNVFGKSYKEAESIFKDASKGALDLNLPMRIHFMEKKEVRSLMSIKQKTIKHYSLKKLTDRSILRQIKL